MKSRAYTLQGIYELTDDTWKVCIASQRPTAFATQKGKSGTCYTLKRAPN